MTTILHKRGTGQPNPDELKVGEIAIDTSTGTLYTKQTDGTVVEIGGGVEGGDGGASSWDELTGKPTEFPPEAHGHEEIAKDAAYIKYEGDTWKASPSMEVEGSLSVSGDSSLTGGLEVGGNIDASGSISVDGDLAITGKIEGDLTVNGNITIDGGQIIDPDGNPAADTNIPILEAPPEDPELGERWFSSTDGYLYIWYGAEWVAANMAPPPDDDDGDSGGDPNWKNVELLLNGEEGLVDSTGNYTMTVHGAVEIASDVVKYGSGSVNTKSSGNYLSANPFVHLNVPFTIEAWVYQTSLRVCQVVARWRNVEYSWKLEFLSSGALQAVISHNGYDIPRNGTITTSDRASPNQWHHVALSWDGAEYRIFLDGKSAPKTYASKEPPHNPVQTDLTIAARITSSSASEWLYGYIDDLRITRGVCRYTEDFEVPAEHPTELQRTVYLPAAPMETQEEDNDADLS